MMRNNTSNNENWKSVRAFFTKAIVCVYASFEQGIKNEVCVTEWVTDSIVSLTLDWIMARRLYERVARAGHVFVLCASTHACRESITKLRRRQGEGSHLDLDDNMVSAQLTTEHVHIIIIVIIVNRFTKQRSHYKGSTGTSTVSLVLHSVLVRYGTTLLQWLDKPQSLSYLWLSTVIVFTVTDKSSQVKTRQDNTRYTALRTSLSWALHEKRRSRNPNPRRPTCE